MVKNLILAVISFLSLWSFAEVFAEANESQPNMPKAESGTPDCSGSLCPRQNNTGSNSDRRVLPKVITLNQAMEIALLHNQELALIRGKVREQEAALLQARASNGPVLMVDTSAQQTDSGLLYPLEGKLEQAQTSSQMSLKAEQVLYEGGAGLRRIDVARLLLDAALQEEKFILSNLAYDIKVKFAAALFARDKVAVNKKSLELLEEEYAQEQKRFAAGTVSQFNVLRAEVAVANSKTPLIKAENAQVITLEELRESMGFQEDLPYQDISSFAIEGEFVIKRYEFGLANLLEKALRERPDLQSLELSIQAAAKSIELAEAGYLPVVALFGSYGWEQDRFSDSLDDQFHGWRVGTSLNWKVFDSFLTEGKVDSAKARFDQAVSEASRKKLSIEVEVRRAHSTLNEAWNLVQASSKVVEQGEESARLAKNRLDAGVGTQLELLDAQYALTVASTNYVEALFFYTVGLAGIDRVTGQGFTEIH